MAEAKQTESVLVTMTDGRKVSFVGKKRMLKETIEEGGRLHVRFDFLNGETRTYTLPETLYAQFALHGASQKIGDEAAAEKTTDDMLAAIDNIIHRLTGPDGWRAKAETGGFAGAGVVVRALMEVTGKTRDEVNDWVETKLQNTEGLTRAKLYASLRATERLAPIVRRLEEESNKKNAGVGEEMLKDLPA